MDIKDISAAVSVIAGAADIPENEAAKAITIDRDEVTVGRKVTVKNFYSNPRFYVGLGLAIVGGVSGNVPAILGAITSIFGN